MSSLYFNVYEYKIIIESEEFNTNKLKINLDFDYFCSTKNLKNDLSIKIHKLHSFERKGFFIGKTFMCEVRQVTLNKRQLIYREKSTVLAVVNDISSGKKREVDIFALNQEIIDDILYFLINSCVGEYLDCSGLVRLHAFSYTSLNQTGLVYGPSGSGKSTLVISLLKHESVKIYSDEITIFDIKNKVLLPYPIRIATADLRTSGEVLTKFTYFFNVKNLIPIPKNRIAIKKALTHFYCLSYLKKPKIYYLFCIIVGFGLIQMWEYLLRINNPKSIYKILRNRIKLCIILNEYTLLTLNRTSSIEDKTSSLL